MLNNNNIVWKTRAKELLIDYLFILGYLVILFGINMLIYFVILGGIPSFNQLQSQLIALFFSVIPIIVIFSFLDYNKGTFGKRKAGLKVYYKNKKFIESLLRNIIKFLPWQLGHIGVIEGIYTNYESWTAIFFSYLSLILMIILLGMGFCRKDKRHLGDLLANTQVQVK